MPERAAASGTGRFDVAIAGGGPLGCTLALALARLGPRGFRIALVGAEPAGKGRNGAGDARSYALSAASKNLLSALDLWPKLAPFAQAIETIEITDSALNAALRPHLLGFDNELGENGKGAFMVEHGDLARVLGDAVAVEPAITLYESDRATGFASGPFAVEVALDRAGTMAASLLVAADGKRSALRERAGIKCVGWSYPQAGIVTTVAHERPHHGKAVQHFLPSGPFAVLPLTGNRSSIVWTEDADLASAIMEAGEDRFLVELGKRFGHRLGAISLAGPRQSFSLDMQIARNFVADRFALIGDAAHVVHPLAGQGLNIGMRDVAALTETLIEAARLGLDIGGAVPLERYERWRRFDSAFSAAVMDGLNRLFSNDSAPLRALRDLGLGIVDRVPAVKRFLVSEAAGRTGTVPCLLRGERF
jgi:2-octaprenyl-6-methoxyphenol hydroxylase